MNVIEAIESRHSVRAFLDKPVSDELLTRVVAAAPCAPSWACTRPWIYYVATGDVLKRIREQYVELYTSGAPRANDLPTEPKWPERENENQLAWGRQRCRVQWNIDPNSTDPAEQARFDAIKKHMRIMAMRFFDAPAVIFPCMDKRLHNWALYDMGAGSMNIQLAAHELGLGCITAYHMGCYPEVLRRELNIPEHLNILLGIAVGYKDEESCENRDKAVRTPVDEILTIVH
ncbi:MAG: nitroreductase [Oscillospiraceae bacterium]|nr:nitroreductase [Oscillospiraceae bacterium]